MKNNFKHNGSKVLVVVLCIIIIVTVYYLFRLRDKYNVIMNNTYTESFSNLVNYINNVENYLAKSMISKSHEHAAETLTQIWRDSNLAIVYLSRIPLENEGFSQTSKFLNQVSDYAFSLSRKNINGEELSEEDFKNLKTLYEYSINLEFTLNQLSEELYSGEINWDSLKTNNNLKFAQSVDSINVFSNIDDNLNEYEGLIYDGAYSDHVNKVEKKGLTGENIDEEKAREKVSDFFGKESIENIESNGYIENADIPVYDFSVKLKDKEEKINIAISRKGAHVVQTETNREVVEEKISGDEAKEKGKKYLSEKGFENMKETYYIKQGNIVTVNYAYDDNGIIIYPDLIKVKIALDNGEILGIETMGYLNSHTERSYNDIEISKEEAKNKLNKDLSIISENMAVIPTEWKTEILCYEFKGKVENKEFLVYINAKTGKEENILVVLDTPGGVLTV